MNYTVEKTENKNKLKITVTLTAEEWEAANRKAYEKNKEQYSVQGFRKGKVPFKVLESVYGKGLFYEEAFNEAVPTYYTQVLEKEPDIYPVASPDIDISELDDNGVVFVAEVTIKPEVELGDYKAVRVKKGKVKITDADIDAELEKARERAGRLINIDDRAAAKGDTAIIDYSGSTDGVKFEGGSAENQPLELGSGTFIPGFEEQVEGMVIGEKKDINVKFPDNYAPQLAGKDAVFAVALKELKVKELPELSDEFAKDVSEFDTLDAYKADIKANLTKSAEAKIESEYEDKILDEITAISKVDIPVEMVDSQVESMVQEMQYRLMYQGMKIEDYLKYTDTTMEGLKDSYKEQAEKSVKGRLILEAVLKAEDIKETEQEVDEKLAEMAAKAKKELSEFKKTIPQQQLDYAKNQVIMDKLFTTLKNYVSQK